MPDQGIHCVDSPNINRADFGYAVWIPAQTPDGREVTIQSGERHGSHIMHAETADQSTLYFEITAYADRQDHRALAQGQRDFLKSNATDVTLTTVSLGRVGNFTGNIFDFSGSLRGNWKDRRFLFVDADNRTYRVVHDPTSLLNERVLNSLVLAPFPEDA